MVYVSLLYTHTVKLNKKKPSTLILMYLLRFFCTAKQKILWLWMALGIE